MKSINIDWSDWEGEKLEEIDFTCPFCYGEFDGKKKFELLNKDELKEVKKSYTKDEGNGEIENYYNENYDNFDFWCENCTEGRLEPIMNYAYPVNCDLSEDNRKKALDCGLFLFEHPKDAETCMALMGGGMDLSPNILLAYLELEGSISLEWAIEFRQDYKAYLSEKSHKRIAKACLETIKNNLRSLRYKKKTIEIFLKKPKLLKKRIDERKKEFEKRLKNASKIQDGNIKALIAFSALSKATEEIVE